MNLSRFQVQRAWALVKCCFSEFPRWYFESAIVWPNQPIGFSGSNLFTSPHQREVVGLQFQCLAVWNTVWVLPFMIVPLLALIAPFQLGVGLKQIPGRLVQTSIQKSSFPKCTWYHSWCLYWVMTECVVCGKNAEVFGMISDKYAWLVVLQELPTLVEKLLQSAKCRYIYILIDKKVLNVSKILGPRRKKNFVSADV